MREERRRIGWQALAAPLLLLAIGTAMAWSVWHWRGQGHPLTGAGSIDLCAQLNGVPHLAGLVPGIQPSYGTAGACQWRDGRGEVQLEAMLATTRSATLADAAADLHSIYASWRNEVRAAGAADLDERKQDGVHRLHYRRGNVHEWVLEDHGVLLWLRSPTLDAPSLAATGEDIAVHLRHPAP